MERNLGGTCHHKTSVGIQRCTRYKGFHHRLVICQRMIGAFGHIGAAGKHGIHIPAFITVRRAEIPLIIRADRNERFPVRLRMNQYLRILCFMKIQNRLQDLIRHFD